MDIARHAGLIPQPAHVVPASALVSAGKAILPRHLALGVPGWVVQELMEGESKILRATAAHYVARAQVFLVAS